MSQCWAGTETPVQVCPEMCCEASEPESLQLQGAWSREGTETMLTWSPRSSSAFHTPAGKTAEGSRAAPGCSVRGDKAS